jgi:hypothetical protein
MTKLDVQIFSGYITVQLVLSSWIASHPINSIFPKIGIILIDLVLAGIALKLLFNDYRRRKEVVEIIKNINEALNFDTKDVYLPEKPINVETKSRSWFPYFMIGIIFGVIGIIMVAFGGIVITTSTN